MQKTMFKVIPFIIIIICGFDAYPQDSRNVTGIVTAGRQFPLNKVKVVSSGTGNVVYTDSVGRFAVMSNPKDVLILSASGFIGKKVKTGKQISYIIDLDYKDNVSNFNDAVGNGHISETALKKVVEAKQLKNVRDYSKYSSIWELISTEVYEVRVKGTVVTNKKVRSFDSNPQVLYVVDDKIISDISFINPSDVKSIEFVDDVGATIYGSKGANGVLKIVLK
jgi:hypothetical protein